MDMQKIPAAKLNPAAYNPRKDLKPGDAEYEKLRRSIEEFGYVEPIIWNSRTGNIVGGHQRYKVLAALGYDEVDCVVLDVDENKEKALNVALNKISGEFDIPLLTDLLKDIGASGFDVSLTGFDAAEMDSLFKDGVVAGIKEDNFDEPLPETPISKQGDIWFLGRHRLICGDATKPETYERLMDGKQANLKLSPTRRITWITKAPRAS
jgi:ParB-like chromosome segregation protein Spo0J